MGDATTDFLAAALTRHDLSYDERRAACQRLIQRGRLELESVRTQAWCIAGYADRSFSWAYRLITGKRS